MTNNAPGSDARSSDFRLASVFRKPRRISVTLPEAPYRHLIERSLHEGRSLSNLAAFLLEEALQNVLESEQVGVLQARGK